MLNNLDNLNILTFKYAIKNKIPKRLVIWATSAITSADEIIVYRTIPYYFSNLLALLQATQFYDYNTGVITSSLPIVTNIIDDIFLYLRRFNSDIISYDVYNTYIYNLILSLQEHDIDLTNTDTINTLINNRSPVAVLLQNMLNIVNSYLDQNNNPILPDIYQLLVVASNWDVQLDEDYYRDQFYLINIEQVQKTLASFSEVQHYISPLLFHGFDLIFTPTSKILSQYETSTSIFSQADLKLEYWMGIDMFNELVLSREVFYVRYNDQYKNSKFKLYTGTDQNGVPTVNMEDKNLQYDKLLPPLEDTTESNHIYLMLFLGDHNQNVNEVSKDFIQLVTYNLNTNTMKVRIPVKNDKQYLSEYAINRLQKAFHFLTLPRPQQTNITAEFYFWNWSFVDMVLFDAILNINALQVYLYADETIKSFALRKKVDFKYRSISVIENQPYKRKNLEITLSNQVTTLASQQTIINTVNNQNIEMYIKDNTPYVRILITEAISEDNITEFLYIFPMLISYYESIKDSLSKPIQSTIDYIANLTITVEAEKNSSKHKKIKQIDNKSVQEYNSLELKHYAPDLFVANYNRRCKLFLLPSIILPQNIISWAQANPTRQFIPYPPPSVSATPRFYLTCMQPNTPFINIKYNQHLINRDTHPFIFCCHPNNKLLDEEGQKRFIDYYANNKSNFIISAKARNVLVTQRILPPKGLAILSYNFSTLLALKLPNVQFLRYGINLSPNSFIHALCTAVQDPNYINLNDSDKEQYVHNIRLNVSKYVSLAVLKQENYDKDEVDLAEHLNNVDAPLDPIRYYRIFEELFDINIYLVGLSELGKRGTGQEHKDNNGQKILHEVVLQIPRTKFYHYRVRRQRPTVLIYRNFGSEADATDYLQNELVVALEESTSLIQTLYSPTFGNYCYDLLQDNYNMIQWQQSTISDSKIFYDIERALDYESWLTQQGFTLNGQYIDNYGKLRALQIQRDTIVISLIIFPSQPLNLPLIAVTDLIPITDVQATAIFGLSVNGYYSLGDMSNALYVITDKYSNILFTTVESPSDRLIKLRRTLSIIKQLILWLLSIHGQKNLATFYQYFIVPDINIDDSSLIYDISKLKRILPTYHTVPEALQYLANYTNLIIQNKFILYNSLFAKQMKDYILYYTTSHSTVIVDNYLHDYYYSINNYRQINKVQIFFSIDELSLWLDKEEINSHKSDNPRIIHESINLYRSALYYPYFFKNINNGHLYIVQNVLNGDLQLALQVAEKWKINRVNDGYSPVKNNNITTMSFLIYSLSPIGTIIPTSNYHATSDSLQILAYASSYQLLYDQGNKSFSYAALLPLN